MARTKERTDFAQRVLAARKHADLSQEALARRIGLTQSAVAHLESMAESSTKTALIAQVCNVRTMWLATGKGKMAGPEERGGALELIASEAVAPYTGEPNSQRDYRTIAYTVADALDKAAIEVTIEQFLKAVDAAYRRLNPI